MTTTLEGIAFGVTLRVEAWEDPAVDVLGHDPRSAYVEKFWLPVLGPSTTWLMRYLATQLDRAPKGATLDLATTARSLGLGERTGRHAPFLRTVARAIDFDMARLLDASRICVRRKLPPLARRHLLRLPDALQAEHGQRFGGTNDADPINQLRQRGRQLALSLVRIDESDEEVERQLRAWHFHPSIIGECLTWARSAQQQERGSKGADSLVG